MFLEILFIIKNFFSNYVLKPMVLIKMRIIEMTSTILNLNRTDKLSQKKIKFRSNERNLPLYMKLWQIDYSGSNSENKLGSRPLTVIFSWLYAQDKHLIKFRDLWHKRGFDVLIVKNSVLDPLMPPIGSHIVAKNVVEVLSDLNSEYNAIVVHTFSGGGYQFGEVLVQLSREENYSNIMSSLKGIVMDSVVAADDRISGLSRTLTNNSLLQSIIRITAGLYFNLFHNLTVLHYNKSEELFSQPPINYPGLIFYSKDDLLSDYKQNELLIQKWIKNGNQITIRCWDQSPHVLHYRDHKEEYEQELDAFVDSLQLIKLSII